MTIKNAARMHDKERNRARSEVSSSITPATSPPSASASLISEAHTSPILLTAVPVTPLTSVQASVSTVPGQFTCPDMSMLKSLSLLIRYVSLI